MTSAGGLNKSGILLLLPEERGYHFDSGSKELIGGKVTPDDGEDGAMIALEEEKVEREEKELHPSIGKKIK